MTAIIVLVILVAVFVFLMLHANVFTRQVESKYPPLGKFVIVEGLKLHYVEKGSGQSVILLHGDGGTTYDFTLSPLFDQLAGKYRVLAFDRPGLGYSERPTREGWSPIVQARLLHAAVKQLSIEKPVIVGHSRGGATMFAWALDYPNDVTAAVGLAPAAYPGSVSQYRILVLPFIGNLLYFLLVYPLERFGLTKITKQSLDIAFSPDGPAPPDYVDAYWSLWLRRGHALSALSDLAYAGEHTPQLTSRYGEIRMPSFIVNGTSDRNVSPEWAKRLEKTNPNFKAVLLPNTGHELMFNRPAEVVQAIDRACEMAVKQAG